MKIWLHKYELYPVDPRRTVRSGALLKAEWAVGQTGYSDLHPWPEFGEAPLETHVQSLGEVKPTALANRSLEFNFMDREFRLAKKNAFAGLILPRSHRLVTDIRLVDAKSLGEWQQAGFTHLKVKMGDDLAAETEALVQLVCASTLAWRIDFNGKLSAPDLVTWWNALGAEVKARVDFIEDPTSGAETGVAGPWANDWYRQPRACIRILKPARESADELSRYDRFIFTHSMDHPLGQACALYTAARFYSEHPKKMDVCGLTAPDLYKPNDFSEEWLAQGPRAKPTTGPGFGFETLLGNLKWERLV